MGRNRAVPIACPISQLCRVLNLCSCYLPGYLICKQYPRECYTPVTPFFLLGLYLGSESRSANRLRDFSAASCTEPLLLPSTWLPHMQAIPSRVLYARDSVLSARTLPWIGIAQCQSPARFLSCVVYRTSAPAIYLPTSYAGNTLTSVIRP